MGVEQFLAPGENVRYTSPTSVSFQGDVYTLLITDRRILWHKTKGLLFKKNNFVGVPIEQVKNIGYQEKGLARKKAFITIEMGNKSYEFSGAAESMKAVYGELQSYQMMDRQLHRPPQE
ncbi:MAG: hypothetical protein M1129_05575 [Candidatus Thermoplasmatota archaeon]|jgi:hypothetical protein|nr:hypothetical protein [Candidatus Thermoplasmatota archaeon]MCL5955739.1 hypothetical protein [Candidatus Thermoplasmatota archaeon]